MFVCFLCRFDGVENVFDEDAWTWLCWWCNKADESRGCSVLRLSTVSVVGDKGLTSSSSASRASKTLIEVKFYFGNHFYLGLGSSTDLEGEGFKRLLFGGFEKVGIFLWTIIQGTGLWSIAEFNDFERGLLEVDDTQERFEKLRIVAKVSMGRRKKSLDIGNLYALMFHRENKFDWYLSRWHVECDHQYRPLFWVIGQLLPVRKFERTVLG